MKNEKVAATPALPTAGPWSCDPKGKYCEIDAPTLGGLARVYAPKGRYAEGEANARLIGAAPLLLEACRDALEAIGNLLPEHHGRCLNPVREEEGPCPCTPCVLRRAISSATGGES